MAARALLLAALVAASGPTWAQADDPTFAKIDDGLRRGFGDMCGLSGETAPPGKGYYRCVDIGPYRFVVEYGFIRGYVAVKGGKPFPILEAKEGRLDYLVTGPWTTDLPGKVADWYADEVEGGKAKRQEDEDEDKRRRAAEEAVDKYGATPTPGEGAAPQQPAPQQGYQPQVYPLPPPVYQQPPQAYQQQFAPTPSYAPAPQEPSYGTAPGEVPVGGRLLAPGIVQEPSAK